MLDELLKAAFWLLVELSYSCFELSKSGFSVLWLFLKDVPGFVLLGALLESLWVGKKGDFSSILFQISANAGDVP